MEAPNRGGGLQVEDGESIAAHVGFEPSSTKSGKEAEQVARYLTRPSPPWPGVRIRSSERRVYASPGREASQITSYVFSAKRNKKSMQVTYSLTCFHTAIVALFVL